MTAKKVKAKVVKGRKLSNLNLIWIALKLFIALGLDALDWLFGRIPIINSVYDLFTFIVLFVILKDKSLAKYALAEFILPGIPGLSFLDSLIPSATLIVITDLWKNSLS